MTKKFSIGIAGAGLLGRLLGFHLVQQGYQITLFDQDNIQGTLSCGMTAAGMLTPFAELDSIEPSITEMGIWGLQQWPKILNQLKQPVYFQQMGSLMLAHAQDKGELERFKGLYERIRSTKKQNEIKILNRDEIRSLEPELTDHFQEGLYFPNEGQVCPQDLFSALANYLQTKGATWHEQSTVTKIQPHSIESINNKYSFDWVFDCRGLGAKPDQPTLRGVRGELIELYAPDVHLNRIIRLMHPRYALYIAPRPDHRFVIGASSIESEDKSPISVQTTLELLSAAYSLHKGFAEARILKTRVNCRPAFPDNLPRIETQEGLTRINGLYRHGYLLAPCLVQKAVLLINQALDHESADKKS